MFGLFLVMLQQPCAGFEGWARVIVTVWFSGLSSVLVVLLFFVLLLLLLLLCCLLLVTTEEPTDQLTDE